MNALIVVRDMAGERFLAKVEPFGPTAEADSADMAVQFVTLAHRAYLKRHADWLPDGFSLDDVKYRVVKA